MSDHLLGFFWKYLKIEIEAGLRTEDVKIRIRSLSVVIKVVAIDNVIEGISKIQEENKSIDRNLSDIQPKK